MKALSKRQNEALKQIAIAWQDGGFPIVRELAERMGLAGESSLTPTLHRLQNMGLVQIQGGVKGKPRVITLTEKGKLAATDTATKAGAHQGPKHTPGPWGLSGCNDEDSKLAYHIKSRNYGTPLAVTLNFGRTDEVIHANAILIAAAPDLLEALEAIKALAPDLSTHIHTICDNAISKARGETP